MVNAEMIENTSTMVSENMRGKYPWLRDLMTEKKISYGDLAKCTGKSLRAIKLIMDKGISDFTANDIRRFCNEYDFSPQDVFKRLKADTWEEYAKKYNLLSKRLQEAKIDVKMLTEVISLLNKLHTFHIEEQL